MRDIFFLLLLPLLVYFALRRPFIAMGLWMWTAMFFPNAWMYGMGKDIRYNLIFTGAAIFGYVISKKPRVPLNLLNVLVLTFFVWTTLSTIMTIGNADLAWEYWSRFLKIVLLYFFVVFIIDRKHHIDFFLWCVVLSIGFYGTVEALKWVSSGGGHHIEGFAGHVLGDRNELSVAFVLTLPLCYYLLGEYGAKHKLIRLGLIGVIGLLVLGIIGTQSRGGFIALLGFAGYLFMKSDHKIPLALLAGLLIFGLSYMVTDEWRTRMESISQAGEDASFMGRVVAWKLSFIMATRNPFFGGGFKALENLPVWSSLTQDFLSYKFFPTGDAMPDPAHAHAAHSVYFQVMGDHGFAGLIIYLTMLARAFIGARRIVARAKIRIDTAWIAQIGTMFQICIFSFALGGAALSFAYFELMFAIYGIITVLEYRILPRALRRPLPEQAPAVAIAPRSPRLQANGRR